MANDLFLEDLKIGDAVALFQNLAHEGTPVVGRITSFDGDKFCGRYPIIHIHTPHGSELYGGRCYFEFVGHKWWHLLDKFEEEARNSSTACWYGGNLDDLYNRDENER